MWEFSAVKYRRVKRTTLNDDALSPNAHTHAPHTMRLTHTRAHSKCFNLVCPVSDFPGAYVTRAGSSRKTPDCGSLIQTNCTGFCDNSAAVCWN